jgi:hypothetical protein
LLQAAQRYSDGTRPLLAAKALEAAAEALLRVGDCHQAHTCFHQAVEIYSSLGAAFDVARLNDRADSS